MIRLIKIVGGLLVLAIIAIVVGVGATVNNMWTLASHSDASGSFDDYMEGWANLPAVPGVILRIQHGDDIVFSGAAGSSVKNGNTPLSPDAAFHLASVGKLFTAATVLKLHESQQLDIDDPVSKYLPEDILAGLVIVDGEDLSDQITVRQLLTHRSGVGNSDDYIPFHIAVFFSPNKTWKPAELVDYARKAGPVGKPGGLQSYSSPNYYLLGLVIEAVTGQSYHAVVRNEVLDPLGMTHTYESNHEWQPQDGELHHYAGWVDLYGYDPSFEFADGGFVSTADDMVKFGLAIARSTLFRKPETHELFVTPSKGETKPDSQPIALGPTIVQNTGEPLYYQHGGAWGVRFIVFPEEDIVVISTVGQLRSFGTFWRGARQILEREHPQVFVPESSAALDLEQAAIP